MIFILADISVGISDKSIGGRKANIFKSLGENARAFCT